MKTLIKILRSTVTSLLFLLVTIFVIFQFSFTAIRNGDHNIPKSVDREVLLNSVYEEDIEDEEVRGVVYKYLDDYISYIFHKRSYPSLQTVDLSSLDEEKSIYAKEVISNISKELNLEYDDVVMLRNVNNTISNGSIYLLINIGLFIAFLVTVIAKLSFGKGLKIFSISLLASPFLVLIGFPILIKNISSHVNSAMSNFLMVIFDENFFTVMNRQAIIYASIGLIIFILIKIYERFILPKLDKK